MLTPYRILFLSLALPLLAATLLADDPPPGATSAPRATNKRVDNTRANRRATAFPEKVQPLLKRYCFDCHGPAKEEAGLRLDRLDPDLIDGADAETWHDVLDQVSQGEMPPESANQPTPAERRVLGDWLQQALRDAVESQRFRRGRVVSRRLTRYEYANTMRDLLQLDLDFARDLPPEPASHEGFRNNGATLEMSPSQIETYLRVARRALAEAIVTGDAPEPHTFEQTKTAVGRLPTRKFAGHEPVLPEYILDVRTFPRHGPFELKITARAALPNNEPLPRIRATMGHVPGIIHVPRGVIGEVDVDSETQTFVLRGRMEDFPQPGPISFGNSGFKGMIVMLDFVDADGKQLRYPDREYATVQPAKKKKKKVKQPKGKVDDDSKRSENKAEKKTVAFGDRLDIEIQSVQFRSPVYVGWPPASHQRILFESEHRGDEPRYAREVLSRFMMRAFRRPVSADEVEQTAQLFDALRPETDSFEEAIRETLAAVLVSPHFLYRIERRRGDGQGEPIDDYELASRLSYLLWSSMPDDALLEAAEEGRLRQPERLREQVERMLADPRSHEFVDRFVDQWLDLDALNRVAVNPEFFPDFNNGLKDDMLRETRGYFETILREDLSALQLLDSDWVLVNRSLARHYGLEGPRSSRFERVRVDGDSPRGGLLTQAAFLLSNSNGEDSHPIKRAVWILDRLLDSPPAPPPPDVPELDPASPDLAKLTLKQQLAVHRAKPSCGACHQGIDPWGVPLENFDATGRWRDLIPKQRKRPATPVDATSQLPDGRQLNGVGDLQRLLTEERADQFARALVKRLMAYGLGRSLDIGDRPAIADLTDRFVKNDYRLKSLLVDFVISDAFQTK